jgi:CheY-like chemotaxis protein
MFQTQRSDVVIADLELPEVDGWSFMTALRKTSSTSAGQPRAFSEGRLLIRT